MEEIVIVALRDLGLWKGLFFLFVVGGHCWIYRLYEGRLSDLREERDRLAMENLAYREKFQRFTDKIMEMKG